MAEDSEAVEIRCSLCGVPTPLEKITIMPVWRSLPEAREKMGTLSSPDELHIEEHPASHEDYTREDLERMSDYEMGENGLTQRDREEMLTTGKLITSGMSLCPKCLQECKDGDPEEDEDDSDEDARFQSGPVDFS